MQKEKEICSTSILFPLEYAKRLDSLKINDDRELMKHKLKYQTPTLLIIVGGIVHFTQEY